MTWTARRLGYSFLQDRQVNFSLSVSVSPSIAASLLRGSSVTSSPSFDHLPTTHCARSRAGPYHRSRQVSRQGAPYRLLAGRAVYRGGVRLGRTGGHPSLSHSPPNSSMRNSSCRAACGRACRPPQAARSSSLAISKLDRPPSLAPEREPPPAAVPRRSAVNMPLQHGNVVSMFRRAASRTRIYLISSSPGPLNHR